MATAGDASSGLISYSTYSSFSDQLIDKYDAFILDQFGVLHNGAFALDGAVELVEYLSRQKQKKLIILSNTSAPSHKAMAKLPKLGFEQNLFIGAVTSGEEASKHIRETYGRNSKAVMFTWDSSDVNNPRLTATPQAFLDHCGGLQVASTVEEADFLLLHGSEVWYRGKNMEPLSLGCFLKEGLTDEIIDPILRQCIDQNLPAVCANPDIIVQTPSGGTNFMPGKIAERYIEMGATNVRLFGKPQPEHFEACLRELDLPAGRVAHVGDSLHHDIFGANAAGIPSIFVSSGIHSPQLGADFGVMPEKHLLDDLFDKEGGIVPAHVVPAFRR
ncbi:hypothetical protein ACA910_016789 [Epithemia clementina (nom. ined.)]